jgi:Rrf2 family protein
MIISMKVSSRVDYALSCILRVADGYNNRNPITVGEVAEKEKLDPDYVEQLFVSMRRAGLLKSIRGKRGGYKLTVSPARISAKDVMMSIEGDILKLICHRKKGRRNKCIHFDNCKLRKFWEGLGRNMGAFSAKYSLEELLGLRKKERNW